MNKKYLSCAGLIVLTHCLALIPAIKEDIFFYLPCLPLWLLASSAKVARRRRAPTRLHLLCCCLRLSAVSALNSHSLFCNFAFVPRFITRQLGEKHRKEDNYINVVCGSLNQANEQSGVFEENAFLATDTDVHSPRRRDSNM
jgi:hypothetical protein